MRRTSPSLRCGASATIVLAIFMSSARATERVLRDDSFAATSQGRELLKYLVGCALPAEDTVTTSSGGISYAFPGSLGLAPTWIQQGLTPVQVRLLSACILARTNYFGIPVQISLRADRIDSPPALRASDTEARDFPFFEGGFFGNMFKDGQEGYVCVDGAQAQRAAHLESLKRVCTLPDASQRSATSRCNFTIVGTCDGANLVQNGVDYSAEVIHVYLPGQR